MDWKKTFKKIGVAMLLAGVTAAAEEGLKQLSQIEKKKEEQGMLKPE
jgi:hypothetical protein